MLLSFLNDADPARNQDDVVRLGMLGTWFHSQNARTYFEYFRCLTIDFCSHLKEMR
ncbi:hypothetical protein Q31b_00460 [Novipirellula aureliae]|uniref:Uncharacterized protein n=1 Tax=Novipirellula aureliae TaxID=2527966 RepID=A0A5C6EBI9_9BACT|nr:hypothetical protein Q31b_00460 [Novipirellula aureliae]